jgi:uncharacterized protein involved in outer membrane biogenesis
MRRRLTSLLRSRGLRAIAWTALAAAGIVALALALHGEWLRPLLEHRLSATWGRPVRIEAAALQWRSGPRVALDRVTIEGRTANEPPLLVAREVGLRMAPWRLLSGRLALAELRLAGAALTLQRDPDGEVNWIRSASSQRARRPMQIDALILEDVGIAYFDAGRRVVLGIRVDSLPPQENEPWRTRIEFEGRVGNGRVQGQALTGPVLTLRETGQPFPFRGRMKAGRTDVEADGTIADALSDLALDTRLRISGPSLASLYPTLPLALPETPPYRIEGRFRHHARRYVLDDHAGRIGRTDIRGSGRFDLARARPLLTADLRSERLALADLGVLIGVGRSTGQRVLPDARFDASRMHAIDAEVVLRARDLAVNPAIPLEDFAATLRLDDGVLRIDPLKFGFSGGAIVAAITLDSRPRPIEANASIDLREVDFARLFPTLDRNRLSAGELGAQIRLRGRGQSVAEFLGTSHGTLAAAMSGGRISQSVIAAASLDGGKLLPLLIRGDEPTTIRCAGISMDVDAGIARSRTLVFDTEDVRIDGTGAVDLAAEQFELELRPQPKKPSVLSLRAPIHVNGSFRAARVAVSAGALLRGGAAVALAAVNPLAALLPLIETGQGEDSNCAEVLAAVAPALEQAEGAPARARAASRPRR